MTTGNKLALEIKETLLIKFDGQALNKTSSTFFLLVTELKYNLFLNRVFNQVMRCSKCLHFWVATFFHCLILTLQFHLLAIFGKRFAVKPVKFKIFKTVLPSIYHYKRMVWAFNQMKTHELKKLKSSKLSSVKKFLAKLIELD